MIPSLKTWAGTTALILTLIFTVALTYFSSRKSEGNLRPIAVFFLFLGPVLIGINMVIHTLQTLYEAISALTSGTFTYDFKFYSLVLIGIVLTYQSVSLIKHGIAKCMFRLDNMTRVYKSVIFICLISVSTIPFTPIGSLSVLACITTLISLKFVHKFRDIAPTAFI